jgi:hydrogenase expression/formation protein HypD
MRQNRYLDEFKARRYTAPLVRAIKRAVSATPITLMEVCGTHTVAIYRYGINTLLPRNIGVLSGPGCPVCVTPNEFIDRAIAYSQSEKFTIVTFGDMMKVPGSRSSLAREKARGADIRIVYSALESLNIAARNSGKEVVFLAIGFETTAPTVAAAVQEAKKRGLGNFHILCEHKVLPPALRAIAEGGEVRIQGLICPGHVSVVTGLAIYEFLARDYGIACVVAGFEPVDILKAIYRLVSMIVSGESRVVNEYSRVVLPQGNQRAQQLMQEVFEPCDARWRGLGILPLSGLRLRREYGEFDAARAFPVSIDPPHEHPQCICGEILRGTKIPTDCSLFRTMCTPETPVGACMVSSEGNCAAYYKYSIDK